MSKEFVHTFAVVVANNVLINTFDLRRRDVDQATAFAYFAKQQQNYVDVVVSDETLDATFYHNAEKTTFTRLIVRDQDDAKTCCERCAALRGQKHESYCDVETKAVVTTESATVEKKTALSVLSKLTLKSAVSTSVKESVASEDAQEKSEESEDTQESKSEDAQALTEKSEDVAKSDVKAKLKSAQAK